MKHPISTLTIQPSGHRLEVRAEDATLLGWLGPEDVDGAAVWRAYWPRSGGHPEPSRVFATATDALDELLRVVAEEAANA